ncbi:antibiotic biosynthesis monooxygenase [Aliifodinibius sp. 1BSP15-2V2]|uniref:Antibiotic biosynthesis monooxygenase n=2 Tax=Fodinibius salsisoli TaxID=2820877 RepID=A0ABT3PHW1_9BACT|nr:antibiotic biosynthesis monooxygenase [Fodinibius salsisoli]
MGQPEKRIHIDKFTVPKQGIEEFTKRLRKNPNIIKKLPGFIKHEVYQRRDESGNLICMTIAEWESAEALENAKKTVKAAYEEENFDPAEMFERLGITADRGVYSIMKENI